MDEGDWHLRLLVSYINFRGTYLLNFILVNQFSLVLFQTQIICMHQLVYQNCVLQNKMAEARPLLTPGYIPPVVIAGTLAAIALSWKDFARNA